MKLGLVKISKIDLGDRAREDYKDLDSLAQSIKDRELINPIAVSIHPVVEDGYLMAAGGRRLAACKLLDWEEIPCRIYDHVLSNLELFSIELEENIKREDLEYHEEVKLKKKIHEIQVEIHGEKTSTTPDAPGISMRDTAKLLGISHAKLSDDIALARAMETYPELQLDDCKNRQEAIKLKQKAEDAVVRQVLAKKAEEIMGKEDTFRSRLSDAYVIKDFFEGVKQIPDGIMDLIEIDPPYAIDLGKVKKVNKDIRVSNYDYGEEGYEEVTADGYPAFMQRTFRECYRVASPNSWLICWHAWDWADDMFGWLIESGFDSIRIPGVWRKKTGQSNNPTIRLANCNEPFLYAWKGSPTLARPGMTNGFDHDPVPPQYKIHPTERPITLMDDILTTFAIEGSRVLVPFAGSGNTMISAAGNKMVPLGFDISQQFKDGYVIRVKEMFSG